MRVAVVIVNYRTAHLVPQALKSVRDGYNDDCEVSAVVVDGNSDDGSVQQLQALVAEDRFKGWTELLALPLNGGFGWANNQAIFHLLKKANRPDAIHLLNPDAELERAAGTALVQRLESNRHIGAVGSQLVGSDGAQITSAFRFPTIRGEFARGAATGVISAMLRHTQSPYPPGMAQQVDWVTGASVLFRTTALEDAGFFDDSLFLYHEEVELMWRLRLRGWSVWHEPRSKVLHDGGAATGVRHVATASSFPRRPQYWYDSRRLMFSRIYGTTGSFLALLAWLGGHSIWLLRQLVRLGGRHVPVERELRDTVGSLFRLRDDVPPRRSPLECGDLPRWLGRNP